MVLHRRLVFGRLRLVMIGLSLVVTSAALADEPSASPEAIAFFETNIRPVLVENCTSCHGEAKQSSELRLDSRDGALTGGYHGPAVVPGNPEESVLIEAISYEDELLRMPPQEPLPEHTIEAIRQWIAMGAPWPEGAVLTAEQQDEEAKTHWAFQPVRAVDPPVMDDPSRVLSPVDAFIQESLAAQGLEPSGRADRRTLIRRASFDLTGLPPTEEQIAAFEDDPNPDPVAFAHLVERLLASPHYGERWGRYWLDVARYADTKGYVFQQERRYPYSYTYRDYVIRAFNEDKPYDQFLLEQIAADHLAGRENDPALAAMGFLTVGRRFLNNQHDIIDDRIDVVTRGLMGLTVTCARCHDHKYDPIPIDDYYALYGVFASSFEPDDPPVIASSETHPQFEEYQEQLQERQKAVDDFVAQTHDNIQKHLRENIDAYLKAGLAIDFQPRHDKADETARAHDLDPRRLPPFVTRWNQFLDGTRERSDPVFDPWHELAALPDDQFAAKSAEVVARFEALADADADAGPVVNRRVVGALSEAPLESMADVVERYGELFAKLATEDDPAESPEPELEALRERLTAPDGPLTIPADQIPRWFNRDERQRRQNLEQQVAQLHVTHPGAPPRAMVMNDKDELYDPYVFIRGTPGRRGKPVPRQFLKLLAGEDRTPFEHGSGRWELAREIVRPDNPLTARVMVNRIWLHHFGTGLVATPSDFGLRSEPPTHPELLDFLASKFVESGWSIKAVHRLIMLSHTYQQQSLDRSDARAIDPENTLLWRQNRRRLDFEAMRDAILAVAGSLDPTMGGRSVPITSAPFSTRRTVYAYIDRQNLEGEFRVFDFANPDISSPQRPTTTVPQQALFLMNSPFVAEQVQHLASDDGVKECGSVEDQIDRLHRRVFGRAAEPSEIALGRAFLDAQADTPPVHPPAWEYGYGAFDAASERVVTFQTFPHWTGTAWQFGRRLPNREGGFLHLTAQGGHVGQDQDHAAIRRWVAPRDAVVTIEGTLGHDRAEGDGVRARIVAGHGGLLGTWTAHNATTPTPVERYEVREGETIDFVVDGRADPTHDVFTWAPVVRIVEPVPDDPGPVVWSAEADFQGPFSEPMTPLEAYAQVLLLTNEFLFVD